jgi:predicted nuclease of predicted toxin-antitoxin system
VKFKLDENLDARFASILVDAGHECDSVRAEGLGGTSDYELFAACTAELRVLITLDLDFADPIRFPPGKTAGIIVLRPQRNTLALIRETLASIVPMLERERLHGVLWIVEPGRVRINRPWDEDEEC